MFFTDSISNLTDVQFEGGNNLFIINGHESEGADFSWELTLDNPKCGLNCECIDKVNVTGREVDIL